MLAQVTDANNVTLYISLEWYLSHYLTTFYVDIFMCILYDIYMSNIRPNRGLPAPYVRQSATICKALSHPARFKIAELLLAGDMTVGDLARATGLAPNAVSQQVKELVNAKVISRTKRGRTVTCKLTHALAANLIRTAQREYQLTLSFRDGEAI